jgi:hypothetical protein
MKIVRNFFACAASVLILVVPLNGNLKLRAENLIHVTGA